jgi:hypothetical protein
MAAANSTSYSAFLKQIWPLKEVYNLVLANSPLWGVLEKDTGWTGSLYNIPIGIGRTTGFAVGSGNFTVAQTNKTGTKSVDFALTPSTAYSLFSIDRLLMKRTQNEEGAVKQALGYESKAAFDLWGRMNGLYLFGNGGAALAQIASVSGATITLTDPNATRAFDINMKLEFSTTDGSGSTGSTLASSGVPAITAIDRTAGTLTAGSAWTTYVSGIAAGNFVFIQGTYGQTAKGLSAWLPSVAPTTGDNFFTVDRSADPDRLAGVRSVGTGLAPRVAAYAAAMAAFKMGGKPDLYVIGPTNFIDLQSDLQANGNVMNTKMPAAKIGNISFGLEYDAISFVGPAGTINVLCDYNCPTATGYMLTKNTWKVCSVGDAPYFDDFGTGGGDLLREPTSDSYEGRVVGDWQLGCLAPGYNVRVAL